MNGSAQIIHADLSDLPVRFSHLKAYGRCAMIGYHARTKDMKQTASMQRGTAVDAMIFGTRKVIAYDGVRNLRHAAYKDFVDDNPDTEILTVAEYDKARRMVDALRSCEYAAPWMTGVTQQTLHFDYMGLRCRATPDWRGNGFVNDLKTTRDASDFRFPWQARSLGYPVQLLMQGIACELNGYPMKRYLLTAIESTEPYPVTVFELMPRAIDKAAKTLCLWAEKLKVAEQSHQYPPYSQAIVPLDEPDDAPDLVYGDDDEDDDASVSTDVTMAG